ncbi:MAG: hypothetical protein Q8N36_03530 [bacterium]|nr:hypothetical protein [bacterium]
MSKLRSYEQVYDKSRERLLKHVADAAEKFKITKTFDPHLAIWLPCWHTSYA